MEIAATPRSAQLQVPLPPLRLQPVPPVAEPARAQTDQDPRSEGDRRDRPGAAAARPQAGDVVDRAITLDPETDTLVFRALNARGEVVLQYPDQVILRGRAYARQMESEDATRSAIDRRA